jgi:4-hydroxyproline epimerase
VGARRPRRVDVVDSHTGGEPTRVVLAGGPDLGRGPLAERLRRFRRRHDGFRSAVVNEPRGSDLLVGALLCEPHDPSCAAGVLFFNNVGMLGMCGHGAIGVVATLAHLGRIRPGRHRLETPVGVVDADLLRGGDVRIRNVVSRRHAKGVVVRTPAGRRVTGDVAWGGNWFFIVEGHGQRIEPGRIPALLEFAGDVRRGLERAGIRGAGGAEIDHVELGGPSPTRGVDGRNFVLCPGGAYDRSPCGTGTSAKVACLHADGLLRPGEVWRQESVTGSVFEATFEAVEGGVVPTIRGRAHVTGEASLILDPRDPFVHGTPSREKRP